MMRWPLVWRSTLEAVETHRDFLVEELAGAKATVKMVMAYHNELADEISREGARHEKDIVRAESRYADLMVSYRMLRLQGFTPPPAEPVASPAEKPDPVLAAVNAAAKDAKTRTLMLRQVEIDRNADLTDVEIIQRIQRGNRPAEEIA